MAHTMILALMVLGLASLQSVVGLAVSVSQISCTRLYFTLTLTPAEIRGAENLGVFIDDDIVSEVGLSGSFTSTDTAEFYAAFFDGSDVTSGATPVTFTLLDEDDTALTAFTSVEQTLTFECGTIITTTAGAASTTATSARSTATSARPTGNSNGGSNSGSSSDSDSSSTSSGSSSSTGAIAGGVVGGVAVLAIIALIAFCMIRKKKRQNNSQSRLRHDEVDEAAFRAPNNDSSASLATAPENAKTPMMRDISTKNVFADPTVSATSGAPSGTSGAPSGSSSHLGAAGAAGVAAGGIGAAAIAARKQSREDSRARSFSLHSDQSPSSEGASGLNTSNRPPVPAMPSAAAYPASSSAAQPSSSTSPTYPSYQPQSTESNDARSGPNSSSPQASSPPSNAAVAGTAAGITAGAAAGSAAGENKSKAFKWGFKRGSQDKPAAQTSAPAAETSSAMPADTVSLASTTPSQASAGGSESPTRSFNVRHSSAAPNSLAGPSTKSFTQSDISGSRKPLAPPRAGFATPPGSTRGFSNSRAPSVASMTAGFADAPPMPSTASVSSEPMSESGNMAGVGAGRAYNISSGNSTKWHQQSYNIMPNFSARSMPRSTQLEEDLIFGHLGMGLTPPTGPTGPAGNGSESGSSKSRKDPFGDR